MVEIKEVSYPSFGKCVQMSNGVIELLATVDFGPRIIRFSRIGGENVMMEDVERKINKDEYTQLFAETYGNLGTWKIYGGHRLWASPEALPRSYYPDSEPVAWKADGHCITLTPPPQHWNQHQMEIQVMMDETEAKVDVFHKITNIGPWTHKFAPWALSVLAPGGKEIIPMPIRPAGLLHNRKLTLWDYTKMNDQRVYWGDKYITLCQDPQAECPFKIGLDSQHGWAAYVNHGDMFLKRFDIVENSEYPDDGMNFETYTNEFFLEMESLGVYQDVLPGDSATHHETWQLFTDIACPSNDEAELDILVEQYIGK